MTIAILGDGARDLARKLGKKGSVTDIEYYDHDEKEFVFTMLTPRDYPEKIQPVINSLALANHVVLCVESMSRELGELILTINAMDMKQGTLVLEGDVPNLETFIGGTVVADYERRSADELLDHFKEAPLEQTLEAPMTTVIDQYFPVKGIGTVILGKVVQGKLRTHVKVQFYPKDSQVTVRSIQMHDRDVREAPTHARVGIALKGVELNDLSKGAVLTEDEVNLSKEISFDLQPIEFYKKPIEAGTRLHVAHNLQIVPSTVKTVEDGKITLEGDRDLIQLRGRAVLIDLNNQGLRVAGFGDL